MYKHMHTNTLATGYHIAKILPDILAVINWKYNSSDGVWM